MRRPQVMGQKAQQGRPLLLGLARQAQVRQAEQPADGDFIFRRAQRCQVQVQECAGAVAKLLAQQLGQGRSRWPVHAGKAKARQTFEPVLAHQRQAPATRAALRLASNTGPGCRLISVATGRHSRPSAINRRVSRVRPRACSNAAMRPCSTSPLGHHGAASFGQHLGLVVQTGQFPAK